MLGPTLRGEKISLEPTNRNELDLYRQWFMDTEITRYLTMRFVPSEKGEEEWYERIASDDSGIFWNIVAGGRTVGNTAIATISWIDRHAITGLIIGDRSEWGKGYASEAVKLRTGFAFGELGLERLESESFVENAPMHRALEKSGYQKIGRRRHYFYRGGHWHDVYIFELLRTEWHLQES
jgi:[ribosomal protein S5]-alanine N-acetyltransferase